jgi:uncharacterized protein (DUF2384 family)
MKASSITSHQLRRLDAALSSEIRRYERCRRQLRYVHREVFTAGVSCFNSASALALWLCEPAFGLSGKVPLQVMRTPRGRADVVNLLRRIEYGVY